MEALPRPRYVTMRPGLRRRSPSPPKGARRRGWPPGRPGPEPAQRDAERTARDRGAAATARAAGAASPSGCRAPGARPQTRVPPSAGLTAPLPPSPRRPPPGPSPSLADALPRTSRQPAGACPPTCPFFLCTFRSSTSAAFESPQLGVPSPRTFPRFARSPPPPTPRPPAPLRGLSRWK